MVPSIASLGELMGIMVLIAFLTETIIEGVKHNVGIKTELRLLNFIGFCISAGLSWLLNVKVFETTGDLGRDVALNVLGYFIIGLVSSRGANYVHNWLDNLPKK